MTSSSEPPLLAGLGVAGYRSIYGQLRLLGPLSKVNLIAGQNNAGKSNFLRFAHDYLADSLTRRPGHTVRVPQGLDQPRGVPDADVYRFAVAVRLSDDDIFEMLGRGSGLPFHRNSHEKMIAQNRVVPFLRDPELRLTADDLVWITMQVGGSAHQTPKAIVAAELTRNLNSVHTRLGDALAQIGYRSTHNTNNPVSNLLNDLVPRIRPVEFVTAFRQIRGAETPTDVDLSHAREVERSHAQARHSGAGLVESLLRLQSPDREHDEENRRRFGDINGFVQHVLDDDTASLEIPHDASTINVRREGLLLPLDYLGTGVHQVIILAAASTVIADSIVCMEEPELHLHPLLQRKLIRYLRDHTSNQYLIATHSAHLLDHESANVFHVQHTDEGTEIQRAGTPQQLADLCADLGYRPSDLLQANAVVWVEGPSDRLYLRKWISLVDHRLIEGVHYSIMFYGGRLLNHLSANDREIEQFVNLRRLNRHIAILIDSDKIGPSKAINATKRRVRDDFDDTSYPGFAWVTKCRTIENYVPQVRLADAVRAVHPGATLVLESGQWDEPLVVLRRRRGAGPDSLRPDKIKIAQHVADALDATDLDTYDLRKQVRRIVDFIHTANGTTSPGVVRRGNRPPSRSPGS